MSFQNFAYQLQSNHTLQLIRRRNADLILSFLYDQFKGEESKAVWTHRALAGKLTYFLEALGYNEADEEVRSTKIFSDFETRAVQYLNNWSTAGFLKKYPNEEGEDLHELTNSTEKVFQWIEELKPREFVGTDSRFKDLFTRLKDLIAQTEEDPAAHIERLEQEKHEIDKKITRLRLTQKLSAEDIYEDWEIKERFQQLEADARELTTDFSEVAQNLDGIRKRIQQQYLAHHLVKGDVLQQVFTALNSLEKSDQGRSFGAFWEFLRNDETKEQFDALTAKLYAILKERSIREAPDPFLKKLRGHLFTAGSRVVEANARLNEKLSRILSEHNPTARRQVLELLAEIQHAAVALGEAPSKDTVFMELDTVPQIVLPQRWGIHLDQKEAGEIRFPEAGIDALPLSAGELFNPFTLDPQWLRRRVAELLQNRDQIGLEEIVNTHGLTYGLGELVGYLSLAVEAEHTVIEDARQTLSFGERAIQMPTIIFIQKSPPPVI